MIAYSSQQNCDQPQTHRTVERRKGEEGAKKKYAHLVVVTVVLLVTRAVMRSRERQRKGGAVELVGFIS